MNQIHHQGSAAPRSPLESPSARMSGLAVFAIVLAAVPCCPAVSLAGVVLGMAAIRRIRGAGGALRGLKVAQWAVGVGTSLTVISTLSYFLLARYVEQTNRTIMITQVFDVIEASSVGNFDRAAKAWNQPPGQTPTAGELETFGNQIKCRYGSLQRFSVSSMATDGSLFQQQIEVAGVYIFENAERPGSAVFVVHQATGGEIWPEFRLKQIVIEDRELGDLTLPAGTDPP